MNKVDLSTFSSKNIDKGAGKIKQLSWYFVNAIFFNCYWNISCCLKRKLLRLYGAQIGRGVMIKPNINIKRPWRLVLGDNVWLGEDVWIDNNAEVRIDSNCVLSQGSMLLCGNHNYKKKTFDSFSGNIHLEEGCWVGAKAIVCPGVTLHSHSILSVGSVAFKDLEAYTIYQGNPAKEIRKRVIED